MSVTSADTARLDQLWASHHPSLVVRRRACYSAPTMDQKRVRELFALLPLGAAYPATPRRSPFQPARPSASERFALALHDPAFGWNFVEAHLKTGRWLPDAVYEWPMSQAFAARWWKVVDPLMTEVESLRSPARWQERDWLDALLLTADSTTADIAGLLQLSEEVVVAYATLFWNVRDRRDDVVYINKLLYPEGRPAAARNARPDAIGDRLRLLRAGVEGGQAAVLALAGLAPRPEFDDSPGSFDRDLQADASRRWQAGLRFEDPNIRARHQAALRREEIATNDDGMGLRALSTFADVADDIMKVAARRIELRPPMDLAKVMEDLKTRRTAQPG